MGAAPIFQAGHAGSIPVARSHAPAQARGGALALRLIEHAESVLAAGNEHASPDWFTWFSSVRLAAFKGNTQLKAGYLPQAQESLTSALTNATASRVHDDAP